MSATVSTSTEPVKNENGTYQLTINNFSLSAVEIYVPSTFRYCTTDDITRLTTVLKDPTFMGDGTYTNMKKENFCEMYDLIFRAYASYVVYKTEDSKRFFIYYNPDYITSVQLGLICMLYTQKDYEPLYDAIVAKEKKGETVDIEKDLLAVILLKTKCTSIKIDEALISDESMKRYGTFFNVKETTLCKSSSSSSGSIIGIIVAVISIIALGVWWYKNKNVSKVTTQTTKTE
jgi:hypothetical protein